MRLTTAPGYGHSLAILLTAWRGLPLVSHHAELRSPFVAGLHPELDAKPQTEAEVLVGKAEAAMFAPGGEVTIL